jgi:UDP-N-acetyl-D-galactosamine dehydrogenase
MSIKITKEEYQIAVVGLGYVGLPLAVAFGKKFKTIGFDIEETRISDLSMGIDKTMECDKSEISNSNNLTFTSELKNIKKCNIYIVTVPTPIDSNMQPDLEPLISASKMIAKVLSEGDVVIYESTVYPGVTEEICIPVIEEISGHKYNINFYAGYSPERINPSDKKNRLENIIKVTSGSNPEVATFVDNLYSEIIIAGTYKTSSIKVAEASKVIENIQRDVNIALVNELFQLFNILDIDTNEVIEAASTKWNFMTIFPGLVGGHCIGIDPYYLLHKSTSVGYIPDLMRTSRVINNGMSKYIADDFIKKMISNKINPINCKVLLMGFSFKENCPDIRNTKVFELYNCLKEYGLNINIYDPLVDEEEVRIEYDLKIINDISMLGEYECGFLSVPHDEICNDLHSGKIFSQKQFIYDYKKRFKGFRD